MSATLVLCYIVMGLVSVYISVRTDFADADCVGCVGIVFLFWPIFAPFMLTALAGTAILALFKRLGIF